MVEDTIRHDKVGGGGSSFPDPLPPKEHYERYARLEINEAQEHYDPSDHLISHALCNGIPLISDDEKFPFYRGQGLELIEN